MKEGGKADDDGDGDLLVNSSDSADQSRKCISKKSGRLLLSYYRSSTTFLSLPSHPSVSLSSHLMDVHLINPGPYSLSFPSSYYYFLLLTVFHNFSLCHFFCLFLSLFLTHDYKKYAQLICSLFSPHSFSSFLTDFLSLECEEI